MKHALYIIGAPGSGKSTLVRHLTRGVKAVGYHKPLAHIVYHGLTQPVLELGARRKGFSGTDALPMNAISKAEAFVEVTPMDLLLEGDRLANERFLTFLQGQGYDLRVVHLLTPPNVANQWREARVKRLGGKPQDPTWVAGRITKVERLAERWATDEVSTLDIDERLAAVRAVSPVARALTGVTA